MVEKTHKELSIRRQCELLDVNRNRLKPRTDRSTSEDELVMRRLDEIHMEFPFLGNRKLCLELQDFGWSIGRRTMRRLMRTMGIVAMVPQPATSTPNKNHTIYPYLLRGREVEISMDGKSRWMDKVFIERLWRSLKYEKIRLWSYDTVGELRTHVDDWMDYYNHRRKHQTHDYAIPWSIYEPKKAKAA